MNGRETRWLWLDHVRELVRAGELGAAEHLVAMTLVVHYMNGRSEAWLTLAGLACSTGLSQSSVQRAIKRLEPHGLAHERGRPTQSNTYTLIWSV